MKIINKGKYTNKIYKCRKCECAFEIDYDDICYEELCLAGLIKLYIKCPECHKEIILYNGDINNENNN